MNWPAFANPWMLAGLAAVGLPILIHLLTRARPRRITFPPFRFLVEACAGQQAIHRLRTYILLTLRTLAVLALVLLFARPFFKPALTGNAAEARRRVVIVLDASLSMKAVAQGVSLFSRAQSEAAGVLRALEPGSEAAVIMAGATPRPLLPALSRNLPALHDELVRSGATFEKADPAAALALAAKLLNGPGTIHLFSDFQRANWESATALPAGISCRLRPVTTEPVDNVAIIAAAVAPAEPVLGEPTEVLCTVFNSTARPRQEIVRLELGDFTQEKRVSVPPFSKADAAFTVTFSRPGPITGRATLPPDALPEDNTRYLGIQVNRALQVLLINDDEPNDKRSAAFFISRALAPTTNAAGLTVTRRHSQDADRGVLETADVYVLAPPAKISGEALEIIERRVRDGARFVAFLDGPTTPFLIPAAFAPPFQLLRPRLESGERLMPGPRKLFPDADPGDLGTLRFRRHYQNQVLAGREGDVMFSFGDGSAALTLSTVGKGSAVFANFPVTPDGGDFVGHPMFPATVHELLRAARRGTGERAVTPGVGWTLDVPTAAEGPVSVTDPDGKPVTPQVIASGRMSRLALPAASKPGKFEFHQQDQLIRAAVVNIDPSESDTRPLALDSFKAGAGASAILVRGEEDLPLDGRARPLWPELAGAVALLLCLEMLLLGLWRLSAAQPRAPRQAGNIVSPASAEAREIPSPAGRSRTAEEVLR